MTDHARLSLGHAELMEAMNHMDESGELLGIVALAADARQANQALDRARVYLRIAALHAGLAGLILSPRSSAATTSAEDTRWLSRSAHIDDDCVGAYTAANDDLPDHGNGKES